MSEKLKKDALKAGYGDAMGSQLVAKIDQLESQLSALREQGEKLQGELDEEHSADIEINNTVEKIIQENEDLQSTIAELQATLDAVMISVDKWLEGDALKNNPETRASDAREIALKEIDRLTIEKESAMLNGQAGLDIGLNALLRYWTLYFTGYGESSEARSLRDEAQDYFAHVMDKKHKDPTP